MGGGRQLGRPASHVIGWVRRQRRWPYAVAAALLLTALLIPAATRSTRPAEAGGPRPWFDASIPVESRIAKLLARMSLGEKVQLLYGVEPPVGSGPAGYVPGIPRLGVPSLVLSDGPVGLRDSLRAATRRPATALPATVSLAASFDPALANAYGQTLGREARARGVHVLYGPAMNIVRVPVGGRNFEYFSEDPYLTGALATSYIHGVQSQQVATQIKHYGLISQEIDRHTASSKVDERTMREIYLPPWQTAVQQGNAWSVMCGNNPVNGVYACENRKLLADLLETEWGFDGVVGSDYAATHSAVGSVQAGLDQSFSWQDWGAFYRDLPRLVRDGTVSETTIDARVRRVLRLMFRIGLFVPARELPVIDRAVHGALARRTAQEGTVLLRNDAKLLPLKAVGSIAVVGPYATKAHPGGGGSSSVVPFRTVSPVQGIAARAGEGVTVTSHDGTDIAEAAAKARAADVAVVVVGDSAREGTDRADMDLPGRQDALISAIAAVNPKTVVVLQTGAPVTMPWLAEVPTLVETWYPGQEGGTALAAVLFGDADPSGRLPVTFPTEAAQSPSMGAPRYPAGPNGYDYTEGLDVGYRGFDNRGLTPLFPFGHGLSYTTFRYSGLTLTPVASSGVRRNVRVAFTVANTGSRTGVAVPQIYVGFPHVAEEPPRQLKAFDRLTLAPGAARTVTLTLSQHAFEYWADGGWRTAPGDYLISVGASSRDLPLARAVVLR